MPFQRGSDLLLKSTARAALLTTAVLAAAWLTDLFLLRTQVLTPFGRRPALTPLYAFWLPVLGPGALVFVAAAVAVGFAACLLCDPARVSRGAFLAALACAAALLPLALFMVRQSPAELGGQFRIYPKEEFLEDARGIGDAREFLRSYVARMPDLSLHGRHFPPGHALLLYGIGKLFGTGSFAAGAAVLFCFVAAVAVAYRAFAGAAGEIAGRQGALLLLASPSMLDFACASMDAVFLLYATVALAAALRAFATGRLRDAAWVGLALFAAAMASFSAVPVGLAFALYGCAAWRRLGARAVAHLAVIGACFVAAGVALWALTGFSLWECFETARFQNVAFMTRVIGRDPSELYGRIAFGNLVAFALGTGVGLTAAAALVLPGAVRKADAWTLAALGTLAVMVLGGFYTLETERIWLFAIPWIVLAVVTRRFFACGELRLLLAAGWTQGLAMEIVLFTLW
jgi:methylthioxylose transferase